ncbi:MAG: hypothetical protein F4Z92_12685, partial [Gemmatimonadetes bacterium]|nr:hypothetical protein [Gemmatimonadota bacterium]
MHRNSHRRAPSSDEEGAAAATGRGDARGTTMAELTIEVVEHPLIEHKLSFVRDRNTGLKRMRELVEEITLLMTFHATRALEGEEVTFATPLRETRARRIREDRFVVVPILRAGLGMVEGV